MPPADQCLGACQRTIGQPDLRLVEQYELPFVHGAMQPKPIEMAGYRFHAQRLYKDKCCCTAQALGVE
jgi:hypothetical protein